MRFPLVPSPSQTAALVVACAVVWGNSSIPAASRALVPPWTNLDIDHLEGARRAMGPDQWEKSNQQDVEEVLTRSDGIDPRRRNPQWTFAPVGGAGCVHRRHICEWRSRV